MCLICVSLAINQSKDNFLNLYVQPGHPKVRHFVLELTLTCRLTMNMANQAFSDSMAPYNLRITSYHSHDNEISSIICGNVTTISYLYITRKDKLYNYTFIIVFYILSFILHFNPNMNDIKALISYECDSAFAEK